MTSAVTTASTLSQNALAELVGWIGWRGMVSVIPLVGSEIYRPVVEYAMLLAPRDEVTLMVNFA